MERRESSDNAEKKLTISVIGNETVIIANMATQDTIGDAVGIDEKPPEQMKSNATLNSNVLEDSSAVSTQGKANDEKATGDAGFVTELEKSIATEAGKATGEVGVPAGLEKKSALEVAEQPEEHMQVNTTSNSNALEVTSTAGALGAVAKNASEDAKHSGHVKNTELACSVDYFDDTIVEPSTSKAALKKMSGVKQSTQTASNYNRPIKFANSPQHLQSRYKDDDGAKCVGYDSDVSVESSDSASDDGISIPIKGRFKGSHSVNTQTTYKQDTYQEDPSHSSSEEDIAPSFNMVCILTQNCLQSIGAQFNNIGRHFFVNDIQCDFDMVFSKIKFDIHTIENFLHNDAVIMTRAKLQLLENEIKKLMLTNMTLREKIYERRTAIINRLKELENLKINSAVSAFAIEEEWTMANRKYTHIIMESNEVNGKDISFTAMETVLIEVRGNAKTIYFHNLVDCLCICGPVTSSIFVEDCGESIFIVACKQLHIKNTAICLMYSHITNYIKLEGSRRIMIGSYENVYPNIEADIVKSGLNMLDNNNTNVDDFDWNNKTGTSPHWWVVNYNDTPPLKELKTKVLNSIKSRKPAHFI